MELERLRDVNSVAFKVEMYRISSPKNPIRNMS